MTVSHIWNGAPNDFNDGAASLYFRENEETGASADVTKSTTDNGFLVETWNDHIGKDPVYWRANSLEDAISFSDTVTLTQGF